MDKIRVIELFAGYGSQHLALKRLKRDYPEFEFEVIAFCEIDKYAIKAYHALHGDHIPNLGDITKVNPYDVPDCDLITWSFPCTDISSAGLQKGLSKGSDTRSSLCWDAMRIFEVKRPKYLLMENVSALVGEKFRKDFNLLQLSLQKLGYTNFSQLINSKDMGVPQNRLRIFMASILDCPRAYYFPKPFKLERRLKDVLEQNVDERYYLSDAAVARLTKNISNCGSNRDLAVDKDSVARTLCASMAKITTFDNYIAEPQMLGWTRNERGEITDRHPVSVANCVTADKRDNTQNYVMEPTIASMKSRDKDNPTGVRTANNGNFAQRLEPSADQSTSNTITSVAKDNLLIEPSIISPGHGYFEGAINTETSPTVKCSAMQAQHFLIEPSVIELSVERAHQQDAIQHEDGISRCLVVGSHGNSAFFTNTAVSTPQGIRIRRLTERELYRLMDVSESDIDTLLAAPIPRTQHAKLAGNSVVCACYYHIFRKLFIDTNADGNEQLRLF